MMNRNFSQTICVKHNWILTQRIPDVGYYSKGATGEKVWVDLEFVCPDCGKFSSFTCKKTYNSKTNPLVDTDILSDTLLGVDG